jgi:peptidyl-prolyl cis-trans isomerase C
MKALVLLVGLSSIGYGKTAAKVKAGANSKNIATVNGKDITTKEINDAINATSSNPLLVVNDPKLTESFVTNFIDELLIATSPEVLALKKQKDVQLSLARAERSELVKIWQSKLLDQKIASGELKKLAQNASEEGQHSEFFLQQILFSDRALAESVLVALLKDPTIFDSQAALHSLAPSKSQNGEMGWMQKNSLPAEIGKVVTEMTKDSIYPKVVESPFGFHILKLKDANHLNVDQILQRPHLYQKLKQQLEATVKADFISKLKKKSKIAVFKENFSTLDH